MLSLGPEPLHRGQKLNWNHSVALIGEKVADPAIHFCEICDLPILVYGRMISCKHIFCYDCATKSEKKCPRCNEAVTRVERCELGQVYLCTFGAPKHSYKACRRTYLSQRDLQAHINHRHAEKSGLIVTAGIASSGPPPTSAAVIRPQQPQQHKHYSSQVAAGISGHQMAQSNIGISSTAHRPLTTPTSTRTNLITIQLQSEHGDPSTTLQQTLKR